MRVKIFFFLLLCQSTWLMAHPQLELKGVSGELADNIQIYLDRLPNNNNLTSPRFLSRVREEVREASRALGYYRAKVETQLVEKESGSLLRVTVSAGEPTRYQEVTIELIGEAKNDDSFTQLLKRHAPKVQQRVHHGRYENLKKQLSSEALQKGYFQAHFEKSTLSVAPSLGQGFLNLTFQSGERFSFGTVTFEGSQIRPQRLQSLLPFQEGDPYLASEVGELHQRLSETNWFSSIEIRVEEPTTADKPLNVHVLLAPRIKNIVETGIGYSTDYGPRVRLSWNKPWLNDKGHSLNSAIQASGKEQSLELNYKFPERDVANDFYLLSGGIKNYNIQDTNSTEYTLSGERYWRLDTGWQVIASLRWLYESYTQGFDEGSSSLILPGFAINRATDSGGSMPQKANRYWLKTEVSDPVWGSDVRFIHLRAKAGWIGTFSQDQRWVAKVDAGGVFLEDNIRELPPSMRFFAGGDNSIRGYAYESISPLDEDGKLLGAKYLASASLEYQYRVRGNWWAAAFLDAGSAWNDDPELYKGIGLGVRWASPVGPVRLDFGWGLDVPSGSGFQLHFALGPEL